MQTASADAWGLFTDEDDAIESTAAVSDASDVACRRCGQMSEQCRKRFIDSRAEQPAPMKLIELTDMPNVGGGRGFTSTCHLPPGVCVLAEVPVCVWPANCEWNTPEGQRIAVRTIVSNPVAFHSSENLHPRTFDDADREELDRIHDLHGDFLLELR